MKARLILAIALLGMLAACSPPAANNGAQPAPVPAGKPPEPAAVPKPPWKHQASLDRAVKYVLDHQKKKGDWGYMSERPNDIYLGSINSLHVWGNASTALCVQGLIGLEPTPQVNEAIRRGLKYLVEEAPDTPRATLDAFYNVWAHAYIIECFSHAMRDERFKDLRTGMKARAERELRRLFMHQSLDGGWGYYDFQHKAIQPSGDLSTPMTTSAVLVGLYEGQQAGLSIPDHEISIGVDYNLRMRFPNGAYAYSTGHKYAPMGQASLPRGSLGRSQAGDNALYTWRHLFKDGDPRKLSTDTLRKQLDYFFKDHVFIEIGRGRQFPHEAWYATAPYYYYFGHYYASRNVLALPEDIRGEYSDKLAEFVVAGQYDDGSFWDYPLYGYTKDYGTGYGLLILNNLKKAAGYP